MDAKAYSRLLRSTIFQELHKQAQANLINICHAVNDDNAQRHQRVDTARAQTGEHKL